MKIIYAPDCIYLLDDRGPDPHAYMFTLKYDEKVTETAKQLSLDNLDTPVHVLHPSYDIHYKLRFWIRSETYINERWSSKFSETIRIDLPL